MDIIQKLFGYKEPTLMVIESERWLDLAPSADIDAAVEKRCRKEGWTDHREEPGHEFRCMAMIQGGGMTGVLEIHSLGLVLATLSREESEPAMAQMREDNNLRATGVRARGLLDADGRWRISLNL
ncbi:hypothetical protein M3T53_09570 [Actinomyces sp. B33]|uniref:hypothetical protein n=1 Tax=Actinomyces sp. B33 TaxID=2942131 RepID=UPI00234146BF|nr:hypothetical protein [Actinomyces sp. B33]MDC4233942.1 hypothetical protein [Actinomyces sp. B33]